MDVRIRIKTRWDAMDQSAFVHTLTNPDHSSCTLRARDVCCIRLLTAAVAAAAAAVAAAAARTPSLLLSIVVGLERNILVEVSG